MIPIKRKATLLDAVLISENLRDQDKRELETSYGPNLREALVDSFMTSKECFVWTLEGKPICIAGVSRVDTPGPFQGAGVPWMLGSPEMLNYAKMLVKDAGAYVKAKLKEYPCLFNFVHVDNSASIAWLKHLGFSFGEQVPEYGVGKQPFILFYRYANV